MDPLYLENEISIERDPQTVWKVLTEPEYTKQYMYGCEVECDWKPGNAIIWRGEADGVVYVKGDLVVFDPHRTLSFTVFDPQADYPDIPENYLTASYVLKPSGNTTRLKVTQGDYNSVADGEQRYEDTLAQGGWGSVLEGIKKVAEAC